METQEKLSLDKYFEDINTEKGHHYFIKDEPILFLAEMRIKG